ncbi:MAG: hypothetical protein M5U34_33405 [Chloroflexi bacterium]|nr:hypothetical protein [Chloroflexota bacterium]
MLKPVAFCLTPTTCPPHASGQMVDIRNVVDRGQNRLEIMSTNNCQYDNMNCQGGQDGEGWNGRLLP